MVTLAPLHLDMRHLEGALFLLDARSGATPRPAAGAPFPELYERQPHPPGAARAGAELPSHKDALADPTAWGFAPLRPSGASLEGRRVSVLSHDPSRPGWAEGRVQSYAAPAGGAGGAGGGHTVLFDDGRKVRQRARSAVQRGTRCPAGAAVGGASQVVCDASSLALLVVRRV